MRANALSMIYFSADISSVQRKQLAKLVTEELGGAAPGASAPGEMTVAAMIARRGLPSRNEVEHLTLSELLAG